MPEAWIGFASGLVAAAVAIWVAIRQRDDAQELERVKTNLAVKLETVRVELDEERHRRETLLDRQLVAEDVLTRYREPLAVAAFDLQSRMYNILKLEFLVKYGEHHARHETAIRTTLFRLAQYFGWTEILRREIQFLSFPEDEHTRRVVGLQFTISTAFLSDSYGEMMMFWGDEQRELGELMLLTENGRLISMGYASFNERCDSIFEPWLRRVEAEIPLRESRERLGDIQHGLCELVETLDVKRLRYADDLKRA